jgi:ribosomal protein L37E
LPRPTSTWKKKEAQGAHELNPGAGKRTPLSGSNSGHDTSADALHTNGIYAEFKHRKRHAVLELLRDTMQKAKRELKLPVVRLTQHGMHGAAYLFHSGYLDDLLITLCVNRCVSPFEGQCSRCGSVSFTEGAEPCQSRHDDESSYLVRRCADCGYPIPYKRRSIDPDSDDTLFPRENSLPDFSP